MGGIGPSKGKDGSGGDFRLLRLAVDSLYLSFPGKLAETVERQLKKAKQEAQSPEYFEQANATFYADGHLLHVSSRGASYFPYILQDARFRIQVASSKVKKLPLKVKAFRSLAISGMTGVCLAQGAYAQMVKLDGSSTVYPISEGVAEEFQKAKKGAIKVTVGISGTGGGFKKFCRGETDISNASRPITAREMEDCAKTGIKYYEIPVAFDALTVVVNPKNPIKQLSVPELKTMWEPAAQGRITKWNQVNPAFRDAPLKLFGAGADSGTFEYFTEATTGKAKSSRGDYTASEDDNVLVQGVARDVNAIGYFGYAYYAENKDTLRAMPIVNSTGKAVEPSEASVIDGSYNPLSRPIFIYVSEAAYRRPEVKEFVEYYLREGAKFAKEVKYVPLPAKAYEISAEHLKKGKLGTAFGGKNEIGIRIEDLLAREAKL